ncbi:MAG: hypothetical protein AAB367_02565 [Patescibacteria group bacterium]
MQTFTQQQVLDAYERLPEPIKDAIFEEATTEKIQAIGKKHGLLLDKLGALAEDVGYVMLGLIPAKEFPDYIVDACGVSVQKANDIIADLNRDVFLPIQNHIFSAAKEPAPIEKKEAPRPFADTEPSPAFRPSSFAMPIQEKSAESTKSQPSVSPMIFPQKMSAEEPRPTVTVPQNQPSMIPKAPGFMETTSNKPKEKSTTASASDPYREAIL